ncbi:hypothetical protein SMC26_23600 [Actinomadura fulvescens]|uniref:Uncharacterized protein n=1 Tax=Actinomadura fulvescens TaxID=46160 RepID=A0ABP6CYK4_9ACTN
MSDQAQLVAMAGAAAAALVAEMTKEGWASMRAAVARFFGHGGEDEQERQLRRLDADQAQVSEVSDEELVDRWKRRFLTLAEDFPAAVQDLAALAASRPEDAVLPRQNAVGNQGSVVQIGRDNSGDVQTGRK